MSNLVPRNSGSHLQALFGHVVGNEPSKYLSYDAAKRHAQVTGDVIRTTGESAVVGAVLGLVNAQRADGLDFKVPGTQNRGAPIDGLAALGLGMMAIVSAQEDFSDDFTNAAGACVAVYAFRKANDAVLAMNIAKSGVTPGGGASTGSTVGKIGKSSFSGDSDSSTGWNGASQGNLTEDPIVAAGRKL